MSKLIELAERCEAATEPNNALDLEIRDALGLPWLANHLRYSASLDAGMTLAVQGISAPDVLRHAIERCTRYGAPTFTEALPRFVAAEWLRARASQEAK